MGVFKRKKTNRRLKPKQRPQLPVKQISAVASVAAVLALAAWGGVQLLKDDVLPIRYVEVAGKLERVTAGEIRDRVRAVLRGNFFTADTRSIQQDVAALPWVRAATVGRVWPDALHVAVVEHEALARWGEDELVNTHGELFAAPVDDVARALPLLHGPDEEARRVVAMYRAASSAVASLGIGVERLTLDARRAWRARLSNGMALILGRHDYHKRLTRFSRVYEDLLREREDRIEGVDLRYSNGFAVNWEDAPSA